MHSSIFVIGKIGRLFFLTRNRLGINAEAVKFTDETAPETNAKKLANTIIPLFLLNCVMVISYPTNLNRRADNIHIAPSATIIRSEDIKS